MALVRFDGDRADYLVLGDTFVVLDSSGTGPQVVTDSRETAVREECASILRGLPTDTPEHARAEAAARAQMRARRNQPGGYWIAKDDSQAVDQAVTGSASLEQLLGAALLSNGAARVVTTYGLADWATAEQSRLKQHDGQSVCGTAYDDADGGRLNRQPRSAAGSHCERRSAPLAWHQVNSD